MVDDELFVRNVTQQILESFGYKVYLAGSGKEATQFYAQHQAEIALVITDWMMPGMDGAATVRSLKQINPAVKVIVSTGLVEINVRSACRFQRPQNPEQALRGARSSGHDPRSPGLIAHRRFVVACCPYAGVLGRAVGAFETGGVRRLSGMTHRFLERRWYRSQALLDGVGAKLRPVDLPSVAMAGCLYRAVVQVSNEARAGCWNDPDESSPALRWLRV